MERTGLLPLYVPVRSGQFAGSELTGILGESMGSLDINGDAQKAPHTDDELVVVGEAPIEIIETSEAELTYPWPKDIEQRSYGIANAKPNAIYELSIKIIARVKPNYHFISLYKDESGMNAIATLPSLLASLNSLFKDQLKSNFSDSQTALLHEADVVLICYDPKADTILSYGSTRFSRKGDVPGVPYQVCHAGHMIVARGHERKQLAPLHGFSMGLYGHSFVDIFRTEIMVMRTNNRFMEGLFGVVPTLYRSDRMHDNESDSKLRFVIDAIKYTDKHVFHSETDLILGRPMKVDHRFSEKVTIEGLDIDEIIYLARISSIGIFLLRMLYATTGKR